MSAVAKNSVRTGLVGAVVTLTAAFGIPGHAAAEPSVTPTSPETSPATPEAEPGTSTAPGTTPAEPSETPSLSEIPGDAELAEMVRVLKQSGAAEAAVEALTAILGSEGQLDPTSLLSKFGMGSDSAPETTPGAPSTSTAAPSTSGAPSTEGTSGTASPSSETPESSSPVPGTPSPNQVAGSVPTPVAGDLLGNLQKLTGTQVLSPAVAPFCTTPTDDNPLGLVTAPAVAIPGPWPASDNKAVADLLTGTGADKLLKLADEDQADKLKPVKDGDTAYALVPGENPGSDQFRVAWFNTSTMKGGFTDLKPLEQDKTVGPLIKAVTGNDQFKGVRLAQAKTGKGTILSAVFGTTTTSGRTCYFLPALGAVKN